MNPQLKQLPSSEFEAALGRIELAYRKARNVGYSTLVKEWKHQLLKLEASHIDMRPFSDEAIRNAQHKVRQNRNNEPAFKAMIKATSEAVRAEKDYLYMRQPRLTALRKTLDEHK